MQLINSTVIWELASIIFFRELIYGDYIWGGAYILGLITGGHISGGIITGGLYPGGFYPGGLRFTLTIFKDSTCFTRAEQDRILQGLITGFIFDIILKEVLYPPLCWYPTDNHLTTLVVQ